jgi:insertion element IS1 protein InsB
VNQRVLHLLNPEEVTVVIRLADEAKVDEMWSDVGRKTHQRWLWHAIDHRSGQVLAYVFGRRQDEVFLKLKRLLEPFVITTYYTDYWGAYTRISTLGSISLASDTRRRWSASTGGYARGSSG